jgi:hypothetical protein
MRILLIMGCIAVIAGFAVTDADACMCPGSSPCSSFTKTPIVFIGKVLSIEESKAIIQRLGKTEEVRTGLLAHFDIERGYKGISESQSKIDVGTGGGNGDCGFPFKAGERYLVFADQNRISEHTASATILERPLRYDLYTDICRRTQRLPEGQNDVDLIEALISGKPESRIFGQVSLIEKDMRKGPYASNIKGGMPGVKIEARSKTNTYNATTDERGNFQIRNVQPGKYKVQAVLASTQSGFLGLAQAPIIEIRPPQLCGSEAILLIQSNGVIKGRLFNTEGEAVPRNVEVSLVMADSVSKGLLSFVGSSTWTKDDGTYEFNGLLPGDYIIGLGLLHPPNWCSPYVGIYYPSASQPGEAKILHVSEGEKLNNINIHLSQPISPVKIRGTVFDSNGKAVAGAQIEILDVDFQKVVATPESNLFKTAADGAFAVTGMKNRRYQVRAFRSEKYIAGTGSQSEPVEITATDPSPPLVLTLTKPGIFRIPQK